MEDQDQLIEVLERRVQRREERRGFFRSIGAMATVGGIAAAGFATRASAQAIGDGDILNFALNLEYLEANFYHFAVLGTPIPTGEQPGTGTQGAATGGRKVTFSDPAIARFAYEIALDEINHVKFLRAALGSAAVAQPTIDVGTAPSGAFSTAARAAGLVGPGESFDPYANDESFLLGAFIFEDVGVTAYKGSAALISNKTYLEAAAGILAVEAYHAGLIRAALYEKGLEAPAIISAANAISDARDSLDGPVDLDQGISPIGKASNIVPTDENGITFSRSAAQVLNIVYLSAGGASKGGFFPDGVNGTITMGTGASA